MAIRLSTPWFGKADSAAGGTSGDPHEYTGDSVHRGSELIRRALHEEAFPPENG